MRKILLVLGERLSGKTSVCKNLFSRLNNLSLRPYALVEENERDGAGIPVKLFLHELNSGAISPLGARTSRREGGPPASPEGRYGPFEFLEKAFDEAGDRLQSAWRGGFSPIILDEVGPLEIPALAGFWKWLAWALSRENYLLVVSMRPGLADSFLDLVDSSIPDAGNIETRSFSLAGLNQEKMLQALSKEILLHCHG